MNPREPDMASFDPDALEPRQQYKLMSGTIIPRPIALVTTLGPDGVANAAPFSLFNMVGVDPPMLMFSLTPRAGRSRTPAATSSACRNSSSISWTRASRKR